MNALWRHAFVVSGLAARSTGLPGRTWYEGPATGVRLWRSPSTIAASRIHRRSAKGSDGTVDGL